MSKLRRGQRHGCTYLWTMSGGEDKIVEELSAFGQLQKKIHWNSTIWEDLAGKLFDDKSVKKKKWLYTVWNCDRKSVRSRVLLKQRERTFCNEQHDIEKEDDRQMSDRQEGKDERKEKKVKGQTGPDEVKDNTSISQKENNETSLNLEFQRNKNEAKQLSQSDRKGMSHSEMHKIDLEEPPPKTCNDKNRDTVISNIDTCADKTQVCNDHLEDEVASLERDQILITDSRDGESNSQIKKMDGSPEYHPDTLFCVCKQPNNPTEPYAQCCQCKNWFHPVCIGYQSIEDIAIISPWSCPSCSVIAPAADTGQLDNIKKRLPFVNENVSCPQRFSFCLTREEWSKIQPQPRRGYRVFQKGWTELMSHKISIINKYCVLSFKWNKVKSRLSRKVTRPYWRAKALCKFSGCTTFFLSIKEDPNKTQGEIFVEVSVQGEISHSSEEQHTRHCRQPEREELKSKLGEFGPMLVHTKQLASADEEKLSLGNVNDVKSVAVLQKISSEKNLQNRLDRDVFLECLQIQQKQDEEQPSSKMKHSNIQYIAISPFVLHIYSESQLNILQDLQKKNNCLLYLDATGSVVAKPESRSQSVLYYAVCVSCQYTTKTVVPVCEMLTSDQTTATILHWLTCLRRDFFNVFHKHLKPQKIETDFSWAMIHAVVQAFNNISVQDYLKICFEVCQKNESTQLTVIHLCAAHMLKLVSMKMSKVQCTKATKQLFLYCFALLQNAVELEDIFTITRCIVYVFSSRKVTKGCQEKLSLLEEAIRTQNTDKLKVKNEDDDEDHKQVAPEDLPKSLTKSSPFYSPIQMIVNQAKEEAENEDDTEEDQQSNPYYCDSVIDIILHFAGSVPLWSGVMMKSLGKTRDSNAVVENWFRTTKSVILMSKLHRRAGDFIQVQQEFIKGRLKGLQFLKKKVLTVKSNDKDTDKSEGPETLPLSQEEQWKKRSTSTKRKSKYFGPPPPNKKIKVTLKQKSCCPYWGGEGKIGDQTITMTNTCTIDNLLYILHLAIKRRPGIKDDLERASKHDVWVSTLLQVDKFFEKKEWAQGKLLWLNQIGRFNGQSWDAFGTEEDLVTCRLQFLQSTEIRQECQNPSCPVATRVYNTIEIVCDDFNNLQDQMDKWTKETLKVPPCHSCPDPCTEKEAKHERVFLHGLPCVLLVLGVHKGHVSDKLYPTALPSSLSVLGGKFEPAAATYHLGSKSHFVAFHKLGTDKQWRFYDGLAELAKPGSGDVRVTARNIKKILKAKASVGHIVMIRDKAAETVQARRESNEELVKFIVDQKGAEEALKDILSGKMMPHFQFEEKWVPIIFDDDKQLDKVMKYLSDLLDNYKNMSAKVMNMVSLDRIKYMLNVMLSEASINALENAKTLTRAEAVEQIEHGQMEESERAELVMQLQAEMERRSAVK